MVSRAQEGLRSSANVSIYYSFYIPGTQAYKTWFRGLFLCTRYKILIYQNLIGKIKHTCSAPFTKTRVWVRYSPEKTISEGVFSGEYLSQTAGA